MLAHLANYITGKTDPLRVALANTNLLYPSTPAIGSGVLYLDGEGTASAYVARKGAEIFLKGDYDKVVVAGARKPASDWKLGVVKKRIARDGLPLPEKGQTEAEYTADVFLKQLGGARKPESLLVVSEGNNTGHKIKACRDHFENAAAIQGVTLAYSQNRVHGTLRKELGDAPVISVKGTYPLGFTRDNWNRNWLSCSVVMDEADKTLFGLQGQEPKFAQFFTPVDVAAETARIRAYKAGFRPA